MELHGLGALPLGGVSASVTPFGDDLVAPPDALPRDPAIDLSLAAPFTAPSP